MTEKTFRKHLGDIVKSARGHVSQVESHETSAGIPDTNYCINGIEGWIECKFASTRGKNRVLVRKSQKIWFRDRIKAKSKRCFVAVRWDNNGTIWNAVRRILDRGELDIQQPDWWIHSADLLWKSGNPPDLEVIVQLLTGEPDV